MDTLLSLTMLVSGILLLVAFYGSTPGEAGDPTLRVNLLTVDVVQSKSEFIDTWAATLTKTKPVNKLGLVAPISKTFPEDMMLSADISLDGTSVMAIDSSLCESIKDEVIAKGFLAAGNPFPANCPFTKGNHRIVDYVVDTDRLPTVPDGKLECNVTLHMPDKDPFISIIITGIISHEVPGMG